MAFHILIVDNRRREAWNIRSGIEALSPEFEVSHVMSGEEALLEARLQTIDLVISEVRLPGMSGPELIEKLRARYSDLKVILLSDSVNAKLRRQLKGTQLEALLENPVEVADVLDAVEHALGLTKSNLHPPTPVEVVQEDTGKQTVSDRLSDLRRQIGAYSAVMLNDRGQLLVQAGELPDTGVEVAIPSLMSTFSASQKISRFLNMTRPKSFFVFSGSYYDLVMSPVGGSYALLIIAPRESINEQIGKINSFVSDCVADLLDILSNMGVPLHTREETQPLPAVPVVSKEAPKEEAVIELDKDLDALFSKAAKEGDHIDLDTFWEPSEEDSGVLATGDALSYEQALQLGLAPGDEE